jgi:hypothetical protein
MGFVVGAIGSPGNPGVNAMSVLTFSFVMPPVGGLGTAEVRDVRPFAAGMVVHVEALGYLSVVTRNLALMQIDLRNLGYAVNMPPGSIVPAGNQVTPAGPQGVPGTAGWTVLRLPFTMPPIGSSQEASVSDSDGFAVGVTVYVESLGYLKVLSTDPQRMTLTNTGARGNAALGTVAPIDSIVQASGIPLGGYYTGGTVGHPLVKDSNVDFDTRWGGHLVTDGDIVASGPGRFLTADTDGCGVRTFGDGRFYKRVGSGVGIRQSSSNEQPFIESNDGSNSRDIIDTVNGDARYVRKAGDTMTGSLVTFNGQIRSRKPDGANGSAPYIGFDRFDGQWFGFLAATQTGYFLSPECNMQCHVQSGGYGLRHGWTTYTFGQGRPGDRPLFYAAGDVSADEYVTRSDAATKENISGLTNDEVVADFDMLRPVRFRRKGVPPKGMTWPPSAYRDEVGFVADEMPSDIVSEDGEGMKGYSVTGLVSIVVARLQQAIATLGDQKKDYKEMVDDAVGVVVKPLHELALKVEELEQRVVALENMEIEDLEERLAELLRRRGKL